MTSSTIAYTIVFGCVVISYIYKRYLWDTKSVCSLPPGPPGLPWIGNVLGVDTKAPWLTYHEWAKTYGDLIYSRLLGKDIVIINSEKIAKDLLDRGSSNDSDRPYMATSELRFFHQTFRMDATLRFLPLQHDKACQFLRRLFDAPERFDEHMFEYAASVILIGVYDYDPPARNDELFEFVMKVLEVAVSVVRPEVAILVATFPILLKLPAWLPGMSFKTDMATANKLLGRYVETTFEHALRKVVGPHTDHYKRPFNLPSSRHVVLHHLWYMMHCEAWRGRVPDETWIKEIKEAAATSILAASETSHSVLLTFFLMMVLNPAAQAKAQAQIDTVLGQNRLPTIDDRHLLPFVDAIYRETFGYNPVVPLSVPYAAVDDYVYNEFYIPKGAIIMTNLWSMAHDESRYPDPYTFMPERFLNDDGSLKPNDIEHIAFGFGRRICVGRHFADTSVWSVVAKVLAVFKILKPVDESGAEITIEPKFSSGPSIRPLSFRCRVVPRTPGMEAEKLEELIAASAA